MTKQIQLTNDGRAPIESIIDSSFGHSLCPLAMRRLGQLLIVGIFATFIPGADWLRFRGDSTNSAPGERPPIRWNDDTGENIAWKAELPGRGTSSPIVVHANVIVTASSGPRDGRLHVLCFDAESGEKRWERQFW